MGQHMHFHNGLLYNGNHRQKSKDTGCNAVHEIMDVQKHPAQLEYLHQVVNTVVHITCILCSREGNENCTCQCRSMSFSRINTIEKYQCLVRKMKCLKNFKKHRDCLVAAETIVSWLLLGKRRRQLTSSKSQSNCCHRISSMLVHMFQSIMLPLVRYSHFKFGSWSKRKLHQIGRPGS